jgi:hypothetical protein
MSERLLKPEVEPNVELIASGMEDWLKKEVGSSAMGRNAVLDNFKEWHASLLLPYDAPGNVNAGKNKGHYGRLINWTDGMVEGYDDFSQEEADYMLARQMFCAQMYLSGLFRVACFLQAKDQEDYYRRRMEQRDHVGLDIDSRQAITSRLYRLYDYIPDESFRPVLTLSEVTSRTLELNDEQRDYVRELHISGKDDIGKEKSPTIDAIHNMEGKWVSHLVDYISFVASERGGQLAAVPFLEPKSISDDPQPYYPFSTTSA